MLRESGNVPKINVDTVVNVMYNNLIKTKEIIKMSKAREKMCDTLIHVYGMEDKEVVWFCGLAENSNVDDDVIDCAYQAVIECKKG